uniref:MBD domain-containing protein n=1 Tax=Oryza glumipatula TaxID=40148 RepID=A0A0D9ZIB0_9ORYZ
MAGPSVWKGLGVAGSTSIVISDDEKKEIQQDVEDLEEEEDRPGWLPDGWIMEVYQGDDGTIYRYYTSPISGLTFTMKSEVLQYLFSGMDERFLESKNCAADNQLISFGSVPMGPEIATVPNISAGLVEISKKMMDLAAQLRAMAAQSAEPAAFIEEAEPLYGHAVALCSRGHVFKQHGWQQYLAVTLQPRGGGVTRGEALMFPLPAAPSPGVAAQPRPRRWDWRWRHRRWRPQRRRFPLQRRYNTVRAFGFQVLFSSDAALFPQVEAHVPVMVGAELGDVRAA